MFKVLLNYALQKLINQDECRIQEVFTFCFLFSSNAPIYLANYKFKTRKRTVDTSAQTLVMNVSVKSNLTGKQKKKKANVNITLRKLWMHHTSIILYSCMC